MKKRPIYLYILLTLSAILSSFTFIGTFFGSEKITNTSSYKGFSETVIKQIVEVTEKSLVFLHNVPHKVLVVLSILLVIAAIVFLIKQNILYANFAYIAYVLLGMVGTIYNYIGGMPLNNHINKSFNYYLFGLKYSFPCCCLFQNETAAARLNKRRIAIVNKTYLSAYNFTRMIDVFYFRKRENYENFLSLY